MNPMEDIVKGGIEKFEKQVGQLTQHFGLSDKDQSFIKEQMGQIAKIFDQNKEKPAEALKLLADQADKVKGDPKQLAGHMIALQQHMSEKAQSCQSHRDIVAEDLTRRPTVG